MPSTETRSARLGLLVTALLGGLACSTRKSGPPAPPAPAAYPALTLRGSFTDGTPLSMETLRGRPWVINVWLPG